MLKHTRNILSIILSISLILGVMPLSAFAADDNNPSLGVSGTITAFAPLDESIANQSYENVEQMDQNWIEPPETLIATVRLASDETASPATTGGDTVTTDIPVTWDLTLSEETAEGGRITRFTAVIGEEFTLAAGVTLPTVTVTVAQMDTPVIDPVAPGDTLYYNHDGSLRVGSIDGAAYTEQAANWSGSGSTLRLNGFSFTTTSSDKALVMPAGSTIELTGTNTIATDSALPTIYGIQSPGDLTIKGNGTLNVSSVTSSTGFPGMPPMPSTSNGISVTGNLTIEGGTVTVTASTGSPASATYGIFTTGTFSMTGGTVTASAVGIGGAFSKNYTVPAGYTYWRGATEAEAEASPSTVSTGSDAISTMYKYAKVVADSGITSITQLNAAIAAFNSGADDATATITGDFDTAGTAITAIDNAGSKILTIISDDTHRTITRGKTGDLFTVTKGTLVLEDITIDGGSTGTTYNANSGGALVKVGSNGKLTMNDGATLQNNIRVSDDGGGVYNEGTFIMNGGTISGNTVTENFKGGGGVYNDDTFTMNGGTISGNTASGMGGIGGGVYNYDKFTMTGGTISGNTSGDGGGGVLVWGTFTMSGGTISGNKASQNGGGVHTQSGTFEMTGGTISGNEANQAGGGVFHGNATVKISGTAAITGNKAALFGGGVCVSANKTLKIKGSPQITGNIKGTGAADTGGVRLNGYSNESMPKIEIETGGLTATARIGIESMYVTDTGTVVATNAGADDVSKFYISNAEGTIGTNNGLVLSGTDIVLGTGGNAAVTGVTLNKTSTNLAIGGTETLTATVAPTNATNKAVTWSSSNTAVATVSSGGVVTGVSAGTATITVTTTDGSFTATCAVTVIGNGTVSGIVKDSLSAPIDGAQVKLMKGGTGGQQIGSTITTGADGAYSFTNVTYGSYSLVAEHNGRTSTKLVLVDTPSVTKDIMITTFDQNTTVEVTGTNTPSIAVDGLDDMFTPEDIALLQNGATVEIKLAVTETTPPADDVSLVDEQLSNNQTVGVYLDLQLLRTVTGSGGSDVTNQAIQPPTGTSLTIVIDLPSGLQNRAPYSIIRVHNGVATTIPATYNQSLQIITFVTDAFSTYALAYTGTTPPPPTPPTPSGGSSGGSSKQDTSPAPNPWLEPNPAQTLATSANKAQQDSIRTKSTDTYGVRKASWQKLKGYRYYHDTMEGNAVQVRLYVDNPTAMKRDMYVTGFVKGSFVDSRKAMLEKWFTNKIRVIHMDEAEPWGQEVQIAAKVDLANMDTKNLYFYSYDKKANKYTRITAPKYWIDKNGYLHFYTELAGDIIISENPLEKK